jgi:hypothetical protein
MVRPGRFVPARSDTAQGRLGLDTSQRLGGDAEVQDAEDHHRYRLRGPDAFNARADGAERDFRARLAAFKTPSGPVSDPANGNVCYAELHDFERPRGLPIGPYMSGNPKGTAPLRRQTRAARDSGALVTGRGPLYPKAEDGLERPAPYDYAIGQRRGRYQDANNCCSDSKVQDEVVRRHTAEPAAVRTSRAVRVYDQNPPCPTDTVNFQALANETGTIVDVSVRHHGEVRHLTSYRPLPVDVPLARRGQAPRR